MVCYDTISDDFPEQTKIAGTKKGILDKVKKESEL